MSFENYFPLWNDLNTAQTNFRSFNHTACKKRNDHSQRENRLYRIITG